MIRLYLDSFHVNDFVSMVKVPENRTNITYVKVNGMCDAFHSIYLKRALMLPPPEWLMFSDVVVIAEVGCILYLLSP